MSKRQIEVDGDDLVVAYRAVFHRLDKVMQAVVDRIDGDLPRTWVDEAHIDVRVGGVDHRPSPRMLRLARSSPSGRVAVRSGPRPYRGSVPRSECSQPGAGRCPGPTGSHRPMEARTVNNRIRPVVPRCSGWLTI